MRLRTLPLSLAGVVCGSLLALPVADCAFPVATLLFLCLTTVSLQILSNLSNEMGDHLSGVDGEGREGPNYSLSDGGLSEHQMWLSINAFVIITALFGLLMLLFSYDFRLLHPHFLILLLLGAAAIWASTHYTLGHNPYGYRGLGDLFVFIFFGLVSVLGAYFVVAHALHLSPQNLLPAVGMGLLSVGVLNVNNIRDMDSDRGIRTTVPLKIGERRAKIYQTLLLTVGYACFLLPRPSWYLALMACPIVLHLLLLWRRHGKALDPLLPLLVLSTFLLAVLYIL